jgi:hypothetical protein
VTIHARLVPALLAAAVLIAGSGAAAQQPGEGAKFYAEYRAAFAKAKAIEELLPYLSKVRAEMVQQTPKEDRAKMFGMMKALDVKDVKVLKESKTDSGYVLEATGKGGIAPGASKGTIDIVREGGKLKIDRESWKQVAGGA